MVKRLPVHYNPALDGIRAIAVLLVMAFHPRIPGFKGGFIGVDMFFVLSGFLITHLLMEERRRSGSIDLPGFYIRRFWRLTPPLLLMVVGYVIGLTIFFEKFSVTYIRDSLLALFYLSDYSKAFFSKPGFLTHTWSLSVEVHFYLLWPFALLAVLRPCRQWQPALILFLLWVMAIAWRWYCLAEGQRWGMVYFRFDTRISGLILGALLAYLTSMRMPRFHPRVMDALGTLALGVIAVSVMEWRFRDEGALEYGTGIAELATVALLLVALTPASWLNRLLSTGPMTYIGRLSYGMYLWHYPAMYYMRKKLQWQETFIYGSLIASIAAAISYHLMEQRISHWRRKRASRLEEITQTIPAG